MITQITLQLAMTDQMTLAMTGLLTIQGRKFEKSHPWLKFFVDLRPVPPSFWLTLGECQSKCEHISGVPLRPSVAELLHYVYLAKGAWGTTSIEGNTLTEEEVLRHVHGNLKVTPDKEYLKQEVDNIIQECNRLLNRIAWREPLLLSPDRIKEINRLVLHGLKLEDGVEPGQVRRYSVGVMNYRGAPFEDCEYLLAVLCDWLNGPDFEPQEGGLGRIHMAILKAIIAHLYIEWIHPFGDGNGRTGRLVEVQILMAAGVPSPATHLLSNHYNLTRKEYFRQLKMASESGGDTLPFITYALNGFLDGLKKQLAHVRKLQMENAWIMFVHDYFRDQNGAAGKRQKVLLLDLFERDSPVLIADLDKISPRVALAYAHRHARTVARDVEALHERGFLIKEGKTVRVHRDLIAGFLPVKAVVS